MSRTLPCPSCGASMGEGDRFCPSCGSPRDEEATIPSQGSLERILTERLTAATTGEFEILQRLGYGAMGSVYLARDVALSRRVAIKVISPHLLEDDTVVTRFRLEAQTVAALRHPNIVHVHGVRQFGELHYFIMDFIDGPSLRSILKAHGPLDIPVAQALLFQIGSALHYAHRRGRGVIHRDIKPANIMVDREGQAVVMDFGISRIGETRSGLTQTGATIGTPEYMSPEQCTDRELTGASDQYALGVVAYEMLTGTVPFHGSTYAVMMAHVSAPPPPIREMRPDCPPEVEAAVLRMLAKSPGERFSDVESAVAALGGRPLGAADPIRDAIVTLAESISGDLTALDDSSPLSPVPAGGGGASVSIVGLPDVVMPGDRFSLDVEVREEGGPPRRPAAVAWTSGDPAVATVEEGVVIARAPGSTSVTATVGHATSTVVVSVRDRRSVRLSLRPRAVSMEAGGTLRLEAEVVDRDGNPVETPRVWGSSNPAVAKVAQDGTVTALSPGRATVTLEAGGVTATAEVEVETSEVTAVAGPVSEAGSGAGAAVVAGAATVVEPAVSAPAPRRPGRWVAAAGVGVVAVAAAIVLGQGGDGSVPATPSQQADSASGSAAGPAAAEPGAPERGTPTAAEEAAALPGGEQAAERPGSAMADTSGPPIPGGGAASADSITPSPARRPSPRLATLRLDALERELRVGESADLRLHAADAAGTPLTPRDVAWTSSDPGVATVRRGRVTAVSPGNARIRARSGGVQAVVDVSVRAPATPARPAEPPPSTGGPDSAADVTVPGETGPLTREAVVREVQRFVAMLRRADTDGVGRLLAREGRTPQAVEELLARMRAANFTARLVRMGDLTRSDGEARVDFDVQMSWRDERGARSGRRLTLVAALRPTPQGWRLAGVTRPPQS